MFYSLPDNLNLNDSRQQTLHTTEINLTSPGSILYDMQKLLNKLADEPMLLTPAHQLKRTALEEINADLCHSIQLGLKRPQPKSYPPILGLYLLLRSSGLTWVDASGKSPVLRLREHSYPQWQAFNLTEQWEHLLESWFLRGDAEIVGEHMLNSRWLFQPFMYTAKFYAEIPDEGLTVAGNRSVEQDLRYEPQWQNLGLLVEFGFIRVEDSPPEDGGGWNIQRIHRTDIGDAVLAALYDKFFSDAERIFNLQDTGGAPPGTLQSVLQPYFPDWQQTLTIRESNFQEGLYTFSVSLLSARRQIEIDAHRTLTDLAAVILDSVDFDRDHLYRFIYRDAFGHNHDVYHPDMEELHLTSEMRVGDLPLEEGQTMIFHFDFGDDWKFDVRLAEIDSHIHDGQTRIIQKQGEPPAQYSQ